MFVCLCGAHSARALGNNVTRHAAVVCAVADDAAAISLSLMNLIRGR